MSNDIIVDDELRGLVAGLDRVSVGLADMEAVLTPRDDPVLQQVLASYGRIVQQAADYLFRLREDRHR